MNESAPDSVASIIEEGQKALGYPLQQLNAVREETISRLKKAGESVEREIENLQGDKSNPRFPVFYLQKNNLSYLLWRLTVNFNNVEAEQHAHGFLECSKFLELYSAGVIKDNEDELKRAEKKKKPEDCLQEIEAKKRLLRSCYLSQAEVLIWLSQYYANDVEKLVTYNYRTQLRLLLAESIIVATKLTAFQSEQIDRVREVVSRNQDFIKETIGETEALGIFRVDFVCDIQALSDEVINDFKNDDYNRIEFSQTLEGFRDAYQKAQLIAVSPHKGVSDFFNQSYYERSGVKPLSKLFVDIENQHLQVRAALRAQDVFLLASLLEKQNEMQTEVENIFSKLKKRFDMESSGIDPLPGGDVVALTTALNDQALVEDFQYRLNRGRNYLGLLENSLTDLEELMDRLKADVNRHYYAQLYNCFERLFLACKTICSGFIKHTHQEALGKAGTVLGIVSGPLKQIPIVGSVVSTVVATAGTAAVEIDYMRVVNRLKTFDGMFAEETLKYLANHLACELVKAHCHQLPKIYGTPDTLLAKGKRKIVREMGPNVFIRVSEYFCSRVFGILMDSEELGKKLEEASRAPHFSGNEIGFLQTIGNLILDELSHYEKAGISGEVNKLLLKSCLVTWEDVGNFASLHHIFGVASVFTPEGNIFKYKTAADASAMVRFGFIQSPSNRALARTKSLVDVTNQAPPLVTPPWTTFNPTFAATEMSFPALCERLRQQQAMIETLSNQLAALGAVQPPAANAHGN